MLVVLCAAMIVFAATCNSALAGDTHEFLFQFDEVPAEGPLHEKVAAPGQFRGEEEMTVDSGHLWITENVVSNYRVDEFDAATGAFQSQIAHSEDYSPEYRAVAIGHREGEPQVYLAEYLQGANSIGVYTESGSKQGSWTGAGTPAGSFGVLYGLAVDNSTSLADWAAGDVYVPDRAHRVVDVFRPEAGGKEKYVTQIKGPSPTESFTSPSDVAVDAANGDVVVVDGKKVDVFEPTVLNEYALVRSLTPPPGPEELEGVAANDGLGDIYVVGRESGGGRIFEFGPEGVYLGAISASSAPEGANARLVGVATDPTTHDVYAYAEYPHGEGSVFAFGSNTPVPDVTTEPASNQKARGATLKGTVNPDEAGEATCRFAWGTTASLGSFAPCEPETVANGGSPVPVHAALGGLEPDTKYYYRLQATNKADGATNFGEAFQTQEFTTPGPGIHGESVSDVTADSATLHAVIDPHGVATTYYFQYGAGASYEATVPAAPGLDAGSGEEDESVSIHLQGLDAETVYHFDVVAVAEVGGEEVVAEGSAQSFAMQSVGGEFTLPDGRVWEMVTPPDKHGAGLDAPGTEQGSAIQAASDGSAITYVANGPLVANPAGSRSPEVTQILSTRRAPGRWETADIVTPYHEGASNLTLGNGGEYKLFATDLSAGVVAPNGYTPLPPLPPNAERTMYLRKANGEYEALVTAANIPPGTKLAPPGEPDANTLTFVSATPDLSHVLLESKVPLTAKPGDAGGLYEWAGGVLQKVGVLPDGEFVSGTLGSRYNARHAVSDDGSRVIWTEGYSGGRLYLRDMLHEDTIRVDAAQGVSEPPFSNPHYQTASRDGTKVFFTSPGRLTGDATAATGEEDLYVFETTNAAGQPLTGKLVDLTVDRNARESAGVLGVIGASEDGSNIYFVAKGVLGDGAAHHAAPGANLYVERYEAATKAWGAPTFIAALSPSGDYRSWDGEPGLSTTSSEGLNSMTSRVSPDGRYLAFMSENSLTGYENRDVNSGVADEEVYIYDSLSGKLTCASCNPTGARPVGLVGRPTYFRLADFGGLWIGRWFAANVPGWNTLTLGTALYQPRYLADDGRLFFNSLDALVPADVNGQEDVYEYEPAGVGSCQGANHGQSASIVYSAGLEGCVGLISPGTATEESAFMEASENGGDVFFLSSSRLAPEDTDSSYDIYDAHECTPSQPCAPAVASAPPPCTTGDACKASPAPQPTIFGAPSSETFSGAGNVPLATTPVKAVASRKSTRAQKLARALKVCRKRHKARGHARAKCEAQAKRRYAARSARVRNGASARTGR